MEKEEKELLEKIAKQNEEIIENQKKMIKRNDTKDTENEEDPYYTKYYKERAERGILS